MEQSHTENPKRIAKNTLMLYGRMLFSMVVSSAARGGWEHRVRNAKAVFEIESLNKCRH